MLIVVCFWAALVLGVIFLAWLTARCTCPSCDERNYHR